MSRTDLLLDRLSGWTSRSWLVPMAGSDIPRVDAAHAAVQRLADLVADAEGRPHITVPVLDSPSVPGLGVTDQVRVMLADVERTGDEAVRRAASRTIDELAGRFGFR